LKDLSGVEIFFGVVMRYDDPFPHFVIDNFLDESVAEKLSNE
jgi:hypothetical protein